MLKDIEKYFSNCYEMEKDLFNKSVKTEYETNDLRSTTVTNTNYSGKNENREARTTISHTDTFTRSVMEGMKEIRTETDAAYDFSNNDGLKTNYAHGSDTKVIEYSLDSDLLPYKSKTTVTTSTDDDGSESINSVSHKYKYTLAHYNNGVRQFDRVMTNDSNDPGAITCTIKHPKEGVDVVRYETDYMRNRQIINLETPEADVELVERLVNLNFDREDDLLDNIISISITHRIFDDDGILTKSKFYKLVGKKLDILAFELPEIISKLKGKLDVSWVGNMPSEMVTPDSITTYEYFDRLKEIDIPFQKIILKYDKIVTMRMFMDDVDYVQTDYVNKNDVSLTERGYIRKNDDGTETYIPTRISGKAPKVSISLSTEANLDFVYDVVGSEPDMKQGHVPHVRFSFSDSKNLSNKGVILSGVIHDTLYSELRGTVINTKHSYMIRVMDKDREQFE